MTQKGNVLVVGNSGVGKSTLINSVLGEYHADTGWGGTGTTKKITTYENETVPFRLIDTAGFEPSFFKMSKMVKAIKKNSEERASGSDRDNDIHAIWFCIDGTAAKLFKDTIEKFLKATSVWKRVPIIAVITKSYSTPDREKNVKMVQEAFESVKNNSRKPVKIIPVVAESFYISDDSFAAPYGITELVTATNQLLPDGIKASKQDVEDMILSRKRVYANSVIGSSTIAAAIVGAVPIPVADALILTPLETGLIKGLASIYNIPKGDEYNKTLNAIIELGTVGAVAKGAISAIKAIPGLNIAASVINAIVAGSVVLGLGGGCSYIFEKIYLGEKDISDIDWIKHIMENAVTGKIVEFINDAVKKMNGKVDKKEIKKLFIKLVEEALNSAVKKVK